MEAAEIAKLTASVTVLEAKLAKSVAELEEVRVCVWVYVFARACMCACGWCGKCLCSGVADAERAIAKGLSQSRGVLMR